MKRTRPVLVLALSSLLALSACGSDGSANADGTPTPSTTASIDPTKCPTQAQEVPGTPGQPANTDLAVKPKLIKGPSPTPTGVTYTDIVKGDGAEVFGGSRIAVKYVGALYANGKEFDTSWGKPVGQDTFSLTACTLNGGAIDGFLIGPMGMQVGGRRQINFPASFGYGAKGQGDIPANAALSFIIDLVQVDGEPPLATPAPTATTAPSATAAPTTTPAPSASATPTTSTSATP